MYCTVRRRLRALAAREGAMRIAGDIGIVRDRSSDADRVGKCGEVEVRMEVRTRQLLRTTNELL